MALVRQTCGWCKQEIRHQVMGMDERGTDVLEPPSCPLCGAGLLPFETPDGVSRVRKAGKQESLVGDPVWGATGP